MSIFSIFSLFSLFCLFSILNLFSILSKFSLFSLFSLFSRIGIISLFKILSLSSLFCPFSLNLYQWLELSWCMTVNFQSVSQSVNQSVLIIRTGDASLSKNAIMQITIQSSNYPSIHTWYQLTGRISSKSKHISINDFFLWLMYGNNQPGHEKAKSLGFISFMSGLDNFDLFHLTGKNHSS